MLYVMLHSDQLTTLAWGQICLMVLTAAIILLGVTAILLYKRNLQRIKLSCTEESLQLRKADVVVSVSPRLQSSVCLLGLLPVSGDVCGVTHCDNKLFIVCQKSNSIRVIGSNNEQLANMELEQLESPTDTVSCSETQQLFIADDWAGCVWRVSCDGRRVVQWLPNKSTTTSQFRPYTLSVTSRRLLVTSQYNNELLLYGADGVELKRVPLPDKDNILQHAVETSRGTFIVSHSKPQPRVCEVDVDGHVTRIYCDQQQLSNPVYLSFDSDGQIFVADLDKHHVLLLNSETLELERVLLDKEQHQLTRFPCRLCYTEQTRQLIVGGRESDVATGSSSTMLQWFILR